MFGPVKPEQLSINSIVQQYRRFTSSYSFYEGMRLMASIMMPVFIGAYFDNVSLGISAGIGALAAGITDVVGPFHHRANGMAAAIISSFAVTLITGLLLPHPILLGIWIAVASFIFSFIGIYGNRASQLGGASLVIITLLLDHKRVINSYFFLACITAAGGLFYFLLSMLLHRARPYKMVQQALGLCIQHSAEYLLIKSKFYEPNPDYDALQAQLPEAQLKVNNEQQVVRELLFKTRSIVRESTHTGRVLVLTFLDLVDLFETMLHSHPDYRMLHEKLGNTVLYEHLHQLTIKMASDLHDAGQAFQEGKSLPPMNDTIDQLAALEEVFEKTRHDLLASDTIESFIGMRQVVNTVKELYQRVQQLQLYTTYSKNIRLKSEIDYGMFVVPTYFSGRLALINLTWKSNLFRYAIRMTAAMVAGYILSLLLPIGHAYWMLLTIVVILKPAYAITAQRNRDRLLGTFAGILLGLFILATIHVQQILLVIMMAFMVLSYSSMRTKYFMSVTTVTTFVIIAFHLLNPGDYVPLIKDRLMDTVGGSAIAFAFTLAVQPVWEKEQIRLLAVKSMKAIQAYFAYASNFFSGEVVALNQYKWHRKDAFVAMANFSDAFQRMTNEPKLLQEHAAHWHQMVVAQHVLSSCIASISGLAAQLEHATVLKAFEPLAAACIQQMNKTILLLEMNTNNETQETIMPGNATDVHQQVNDLLSLRRQEIARGDWETSTKGTLIKMQSMLSQLEQIMRISNEMEKIAEVLHN